MDNHVPITNGNYKGQGPVNHLNYHLLSLDFDLETNKAITAETFAYFSLKQALCKLLSEDPMMVDPALAHGNWLNHCIAREIIDPNDGTLFGKLVYSRPGHDENYPAYGIYLHSEFTSDQLRKLTGIPFPEEKLLDNNNMLLLAEYNKANTSIIPTEWGLLLRGYAIDFLHDSQQIDLGMDYQLVFKGQLYHANIGSQNKYIEHHYFNNLFEPVKELVMINPQLFDRTCAGSEQEHVIDYAYIIKPGTEELVSINVLPIADSPDGSPVAGVYIHAEPDIELLETAANISFSAAGSYDPEMPFLLLAEYKYDRGLHLVEDPSVIELIQILQEQAAISKGTPDSPFVTTILYEFDTQPSEGKNVCMATDFFHYDNPYQAILKLLHTDLSQFGMHKLTPALPYQVTQASVTDGADKTLARIVQRNSLEGNRQQPQLELVIEPELAESFHGIFRSTYQYTVGVYPIEGLKVAVSVPIATFDEKENVMPMIHTLADLNLLLSEAFTRHQNVRAIESQAAPSVAASSNQPYYILLEWSQVSVESPPKTTRIDQQNLEVAHRYLLQMDPQLFCWNEQNKDQPHIERASLMDANSNKLIVSRFYHFEANQYMPAGFYLGYNQDHSDALKLAVASHSQRVIEAASSMHVMTYAQQSVTVQPIPPYHPRHITDNEGRDTGLGTKF